MVQDYFKYQILLADRVLLPVCRKGLMDITGKAILDVGCGHGGVLSRISENYSIRFGLGIDIDPHVIKHAQTLQSDILKFKVENFFDLVESGFDVILLRDVLEHIRDVEAAFLKACENGGKTDYSFTYISAFYQ